MVFLTCLRCIRSYLDIATETQIDEVYPCLTAALQVAYLANVLFSAFREIWAKESKANFNTRKKKQHDHQTLYLVIDHNHFTRNLEIPKLLKGFHWCYTLIWLHINITDKYFSYLCKKSNRDLMGKLNDDMGSLALFLTVQLQ